MATTFPASLDTFTTKVDGVDDILAAHTNNMQDAILAIESQLGVNLLNVRKRKTIISISTNTTAVTDRLYLLTANLTLTLPAGVIGEEIDIVDISNLTTVTIAPFTGQRIELLAQNLVLDIPNMRFKLTYISSTEGWIINSFS